MHDFVIPAAAGGEAIHMGSTICIATKAGSVWASTTTGHLRNAVDSALVAVHGPTVYRDATSLLVTADAGGSDGARLHLSL